MQNRGQVTLFVIIALLIAVAGVLIYLYLPGLKTASTGIEENPSAFIRSCLGDTFEENINTIMRQGGMMDPDHPYEYQSEVIDYLCYTKESFEMCIVENPMLIVQFEKEVDDSMDEKVNECFDSMVLSFEEKGYQVNLEKGFNTVELLPDSIELRTNSKLTLTKKESAIYDSFNLKMAGDIYELLTISYNILNWEAAFGDASIDEYMEIDPTIRIEKIKRGDGTKIYIVSKRDSDMFFRFASRSLVAPAGYGFPTE